MGKGVQGTSCSARASRSVRAFSSAPRASCSAWAARAAGLHGSGSGVWGERKAAACSGCTSWAPPRAAPPPERGALRAHQAGRGGSPGKPSGARGALSGLPGSERGKAGRTREVPSFPLHPRTPISPGRRRKLRRLPEEAPCERARGGGALRMLAGGSLRMLAGAEQAGREGQGREGAGAGARTRGVPLFPLGLGAPASLGRQPALRRLPTEVPCERRGRVCV